MLYFSPSLIILFSILYCKVSEIEAIVKGENALAGDFPFIVSLRNETGKHYCGGTLVTRKHIVTAAHCTYEDSSVFDGSDPIKLKPENIKVVVGTLSAKQGGATYEVDKLIQNPVFDITADISLITDIAVIVLKQEVNTTNVTPTPISSSFPKDDTPGSAAGWGTLSYNPQIGPMDQKDLATDLQKLSVKIQDKRTCQEKYRLNVAALAQISTEYIICGSPVLAGAGICVRDSGGPLIVDGEFVGLIVGGNPCGLGYPDFYVSIAAHKDFINSVINP